MHACSALLVYVTQCFILVCNVVALLVMRRCVNGTNRLHRWRHVAIVVWLVIGFVVSCAQIVIVAIGCPPLPVMRLLLWLDRTALMVGYSAVALTGWQLLKYYEKTRHEK